MNILESYIPKSFGKEYMNFDNGQYSMFLATALGAKLCYDDWINVNKYDEFVRVCKDYGLFVEPGLIFTDTISSKDDIIGKEMITTTFQTGNRFDKNKKEGKVRVFVSKSKKISVQAKKFGWYSISVNNRIFNKPFIDHLRFGRYLGFPECCVDFFRKYNNWSLYSHPYETFKNTPQLEGQAKGSYYCNNFLMDNIYFFIHNIPCSYRCENTMRLGKNVEEKINDVEPDYAKRTAELLKKPLFVFGERNFIIFEGKISGSRLNYDDCQYLGNPAREEDNISFFEDIQNGNEIILHKDKLLIMKDDTPVNMIDKKEEWFMIDFD